MPDILFTNPEKPIVPSAAIIRETDSFQVQWSAVNRSDADVEAFTDRLVITRIPEGCPGSDDAEHPVVFDETFDEPALATGEAGPLQGPTVGPFAAGAYRLTVTLANDTGAGDETFNCINIEPAA
ncbi:hypothetical protein [Streptomyces sp. MZ04]|uniref:hypothetical protein n=1 Tax=Streptomyces sp. MZ04 TaxID=2559236 RepID=UPI00107EDEF3|nr:hypothetical protein [Streptomyces sp. MZ04]TGB09616.1 hypothetical protein E2651_15915 [Streptomyces sp. MZ04]